MSIDPDDPPEPEKCPLCGEEHDMSECPIYQFPYYGSVLQTGQRYRGHASGRHTGRRA